MPLRDFSCKYTWNRLLKIELRMTVAPCPMTWAVVQGERSVQITGTSLPTSSHVSDWMLPLDHKLNVDVHLASWRTFSKPWLSSFLSLEVNHPSCVWLYIFYLRVLYVFWLYIQLIPLWFLKCLVSLFSDACSLCHQVSSHWRIRLIYLICCSDVICRARAKGVCVWISWYLMTSVSLFLYITWLLRILDMLLDFR